MGAPEAGEAFVQAAELARRAGSEAQLFAVLCGLYGFHIMRAECDMARTVGDEMLEMAVHSGIASQRLMAHTVAGVTTHFAGNFLQAREIFSLAMTFYQREERQATVSGTELCPEMYCVASDAHALWFLGYPDQALARAGEAVALARRSPNPFNVAEALRYQKYLHQLRGEVEQARSVAEGALALAKKYDLPYSSAGARFHRAWVRCMDGEQEQGVRQMRQALDAYRTDSSVLDQIAHLPLFAEACWRTRQTGEGLDAVASAMSLVRGSGARYWEADLNRLQGELVLQQQGPNARQQAEPCFERALAIARDQRAKSLELRAATSLARLWRDQGRDADARRLLEPVFSRFNEGHSTRDLREAKALLED
jgi:predicted ATPase